MAHIAEGTRLGSIYHFFPSVKEGMVAEVLAQIDESFKRNVFEPSRESTDAEGIGRMACIVATSGERSAVGAAF